jgi:hypothetical protein
MRNNKALQSLITIADILGLNEEDINNAKELLEHQEYGLSFDTLITQIYEYDIEITKDVYSLIAFIGKELGLQTKNYSFMESQIRDIHKMPEPVKVELAKIIKLHAGAD